MNQPIVIVVAGEARPFSKKVASWLAKDGRSGTHAYDEKKYSGWKDQARYAASKVMGDRPPLDCAVDFTLRVYFQIPVSWSKRKKDSCRRGLIRPTVTPDVDNLCKASADALTGIVMRDDKFIVMARIEKWYSDRPRVEMEVREAALLDRAEPELSLPREADNA
jgi:Holliday junction resolvase RusA-like endonuclease